MTSDVWPVAHAVKLIKSGHEFILTAIAGMADGRNRDPDVLERELRIPPDGYESLRLKHLDQAFQEW